MKHAKLVSLPTSDVVDIKVCGISFRRNEEHEFRCIRAIRQREHPKWSRSCSGFRVAMPFRPALVGLRPEPVSRLGPSATIAIAAKR